MIYAYLFPMNVEAVYADDCVVFVLLVSGTRFIKKFESEENAQTYAGMVENSLVNGKRERFSFDYLK